MRRWLPLLGLLLMMATGQAAGLQSDYQSWTNTHPGAPYFAVVGHSIPMGYSNYFSALNNSGPESGNTNADIARIMAQQCTNVIWGTNFGVSGASAAFCQSAATGNAIPLAPKYVFFEAAINSLQSGGTWASAIGSNFEAVRSACATSNLTMIAVEEGPVALVSSANINAFNTSLNNWQSTNAGHSYVIHMHSWEADTSSTNAVLGTWTFDGTHPTVVGVSRRASLYLGILRFLAGEGHTYASEDATVVGVGFANEQVHDGDTISVPNGTVDWTAQLPITRAITLQGNGVGNTIITNDYTGGGPVINVTLVSGKETRITGFQWEANNASVSTLDGVANVTGDSTSLTEFRFDHCQFDYPYSMCVHVETAMGVFDHNTLYLRAGRNGIGHISDNFWGGKSNGNGAWTNGAAFGSRQFFFIEDNVIHGDPVTLQSLVDAQGGGRYVARSNWVGNGYFEGHGSEASYQRSTHAIEVYKNSLNQSNINSFVTYFRGGTGVIYSNTIVNVTGNGVFHLLNNRMNEMVDFAPFGGSDGHNPWDSNSPSNPFVTGTVSSAGLHTMTDSGKTWTVNQWVGYTIRPTSGTTVSSLTRSGTTITVTTATPHGYSSGDIVSIFGSDQYGYNALYQGGSAITVTTISNFTATVNGGSVLPATPATGTIKTRKGSYGSEINANTATQLTFNASVFESFTTNYDVVFQAGDTYEIDKVVISMDQPGYVGGSLVDSTATPALPSGWNNQTLTPWYQWSNSASMVFSSASGSVVANTHYYDNTVMPGYSAFTYPHPLVSATDPVINVGPQNQSVAVGATATFTVSATGGSTLHYQWNENGSNVGTDSATYAHSNCQLTDNGHLVYVTVSDVAGSVQSGNATLTVAGGSTGPYYISPTGNDSNDGLTTSTPWTRTNGLAHLGPDVTVYAMSGMYTQAMWNIDSAQSGSAGHPATLKSLTKWGAIIANSTNEGINLSFTPYVTNLVIDGFVITNSAGDGIGMVGNNLTLKNCWIVNNYLQGINDSNAGCSNNIIDSNLIEGNGTTNDAHYHGIYLSGPNHIVRNNVIRRNHAGNGLQHYTEDAGVLNRDCQFYNNLEYGHTNFAASAGFTMYNAGYTNALPGTNYFLNNTVMSGVRVSWGVFCATNNIIFPTTNNPTEPIVEAGTRPPTIRPNYNGSTVAFTTAGANDFITNSVSAWGFVSTNTGLYWLNSSSVARSKAQGISLATDFFSNPSPTITDMGAFQYSAAQAADTRTLDPSGTNPDYWSQLNSTVGRRITIAIRRR